MSSIDYLPDVLLNTIFEFSDFQTGFHGIRLVNRRISKLYALTSFKFNINIINIPSFISTFPNVKICGTTDYTNLKLLTNIEELHLDMYIPNKYFHNIVELFIIYNKINKIFIIDNDYSDFNYEYRNFMSLLMDKYITFNIYDTVYYYDPNGLHKLNITDYLANILSIDIVMMKYEYIKNLNSIITEFIASSDLGLQDPMLQHLANNEIYNKTFTYICDTVYSEEIEDLESISDMTSLYYAEISLDVQYKYILNNLDEILSVKAELYFKTKLYDYVYKSVYQFIISRKKLKLSTTREIIYEYLDSEMHNIIKVYEFNYILDHLDIIIQKYVNIIYIRDSIEIFTKNKMGKKITVTEKDIDEYVSHNMTYYEILYESDLAVENLDQILRFKKVFRREIIQYIDYRKSKYNLKKLYLSKFHIGKSEFQKLVLVRTEIFDKFEEFCSIYTFGDLQALDNILLNEKSSNEILMLKSPAFKSNLDTIIRNYIEPNIIANYEYIQQNIFDHVKNLSSFTLKKQVLFDIINSEIFKSLSNILVTSIIGDKLSLKSINIVCSNIQDINIFEFIEKFI